MKHKSNSENNGAWSRRVNINFYVTGYSTTFVFCCLSFAA